MKFFNNHLIMSGLYKGVSGISLFFTIRLLLDFLGSKNYGLWVLVFTLFQLVLLMDFGLQSSLKTKIPLLLNKNDFIAVKKYIKTIYILTCFLAIFIFSFFLILVLNIDLNSFLKIDFQTNEFVNKLFLINIFFFCLGLVVNLQKALYVAYLKGKYAEESIAFNQVGLTILIFLCTIMFPNINIENKLFLITLINGVFTISVNIFYTISFFKKEKLDLNIRINLCDSNIKEVLKLGSKFLVTQIGVVFIFSSDQYIISNMFGPSDVSVFEIVNKYFQFPILIIMAALNPLWSLFAKNYSEKNNEFLLNTFKKFNKYFFIIVIMLIVAILTFPFVLKIWVNEKINIAPSLIIYSGIVAALRIFTVFYTYFLYGTGRLKTYIFVLILSVIIKVPLSYFFINLGFKIDSVMMSSIIILILWAIVFPIKSYEIIKKNDKNILQE